jgi:hypothetical protein
MVREALGQASSDTEPTVYLSQKKSATIGRNVATVECSLNFATSKPLEFYLFWFTLCVQKAVSLFVPNLFCDKTLGNRKRPFVNLPVRYAG